MVSLKFTSVQALKRSIKEKYPDAGKEVWDATFEDHKKYLTHETTEQILDRQWKEYKDKEGLP